MPEHELSAETLERLQVWIVTHCPCALEDPEFLQGLVVIIELEVSKALRENCWRALRILTEPCKH